MTISEANAEAFDVIVVGYGAAGATAAAEAAQAGARTLLLEKMPFPGGLSTASAGGIRVTSDADQAFSYLKATCGGRTPDAHLRILADGMAVVSDYIRTIAEPLQAEVSVSAAVGNYPLPGFESLGYCEVVRVPCIESGGHHAMASLSNGTRLFRVLEEQVSLCGVDVRLSSPVRRLIRNSDGRVCGVEVGTGNEPPHRIVARGGVILTCGGFEADAEMQRQFLQADPILTGSFLGNTGDGIRMAQDVGADLWHMWHYHGPYGLRHPDPTYPFALYLKAVPMWTPGHAGTQSSLGVERDVAPSTKRVLPGMAWIVVDQTGRRFMNEYAPYPGDAGVRPFDVFDFQSQSFQRNPSFLIFDEEGRKRYPMGRSVHNDPRPRYQWSKDNLAEVESGILRKADSIAELAAMIGVPATALDACISAWNAMVTAGHDPDFGRLPETMMPIRTAPFYTGEVRPVVINTQGGPRRDPDQRVMDPFGGIIPGLFAAGELGSVFGHLYMSGGNLSECIIGGRIAGRNAAAEAGFRQA